MHSSNRIENIPPASPMTPAVINPGCLQSAQPPVATEEFWFELFSTAYWALQTCTKRAMYRVYRTNCKQTKCRPVALSTFYRRLSSRHQGDAGPKGLNALAARFDHAITGGSSS